MGGGQKTPTSRTSQRSESVAGSDTSDDGGDGEQDQRPDIRFTDPSSAAQRQIDAFITESSESEEADSQPESTDEDVGTEQEVGGGDGVDTGAPMAGTGAGGAGAVADAPDASSTRSEQSVPDLEGGADGTPSGPPPSDFEVDVADGVHEAETSAEFAQAMFDEGALSERVRSGEETSAGEGSREDETGRHGTWPEFKDENVTTRQSLADTDADEGVTAGYMEVASLNGNDSDSFRAYITKYGNNPAEEVDKGNAAAISRVPKEWQAHSQMATTAFSSSCGVRTPGHTYDPDGEFVAAAGVNKMGRPDATPLNEVKDGPAAKVDREEYLDVCATQHLAGNTDLHTRNILIDDDGGVHCIDYDRGTREYDDMVSMQSNARKAAKSADRINRRREDIFAVSKEDITDRAQEIAVGLETSGQKERVLDSVSEYDDVFEETENNHETIIQNNIDLAVDAARTE